MGERGERVRGAGGATGRRERSATARTGRSAERSMERRKVQKFHFQVCIHKSVPSISTELPVVLTVLVGYPALNSTKRNGSDRDRTDRSSDGHVGVSRMLVRDGG